MIKVVCGVYKSFVVCTSRGRCVQVVRCVYKSWGGGGVQYTSRRWCVQVIDGVYKS